MSSSIIGGNCYKPKPGFEFKYYTHAELQRNSPSKADGMDDEKIAFIKRQMASFMQRVATELKL